MPQKSRKPRRRRSRKRVTSLATSKWPIVHGTPFNSDSVSGRLGEVSDLDTCRGLKVHEPPTPVEEFLRYGDPVSVVKDEEGNWYASGMATVYSVKAKGSNEGFELTAEDHRGNPEDIRVSKRKGESAFHGSYTFVDTEGNFYVAFAKSVAKYKLQNGQLEKRDLPKMAGFKEDDHLIALNLGNGGQIVGATSAGRVLVLYAGQTEWTELDLRTGGKSDLRISNSIAMGSSPNGAVNDIAYVGTAYSLCTVDTARVPRIISRYKIEPSGSWGMGRLGPFGTGSSPTTFRLKGIQYATVTGGKFEPMSLYVFPVTEDGILQDPYKKKVYFGNSTKSTSEQSVCVYVEEDKARILVANNYSGKDLKYDLSDPNLHPLTTKKWLSRTNRFLRMYKLFKKTTPELLKSVSVLLSTVVLGSGSLGVNMYEFTGDKLDLMWSNMEISPLTCIPLQTAKRAWVVGTDSGDGPVSIMGLNAWSGDLEVSAPLYPESPVSRTIANRLLHNVCYAGVETDEQRIVFGTLRGIYTATPAKESSCPPALKEKKIEIIMDRLRKNFSGIKGKLLRYYTSSRIH